MNIKNQKDRGSLKQVKTALQMHSINHNIEKVKPPLTPHMREYISAYIKGFHSKTRLSA